MKYLVNGTLRPEKRREDFVALIDNATLSDGAWELVRTGVVSEHGYKTGRRPGFVLVMEGESEDAVRTTIASIPLVKDGWFDIDVDPVSPFFSDIR